MSSGFPIRVLSEVSDDARSARLWYAERSPQAAQRFISSLDEAIVEIAAHSGRWPRYHYGTQRFRLKHFPYFVVYRVHSDYVQIIACQHARRRPNFWRARLK